MTLEQSARDNLEKQSPLPIGEPSDRSDFSDKHWISMFLGGGVLLGAVARRSLALALAGGALIYRGATGRWPLFELTGSTGPNNQPERSTSVPHETGIKLERTITIDKSPEELYRFWRDLENLPRFMSQIEEVRQLDVKRSHWKLKTVAGASLEWDAEIINEIPNQLVAWRTLRGSDIDHAGSVHFEPGAHGGTTVRVVMEYRPPAGKLGAGLAKLIGQDPAQLLEKDLHNLKQSMEAGETSSVVEQPRAAGASS